MAKGKHAVRKFPIPLALHFQRCAFIRPADKNTICEEPSGKNDTATGGIYVIARRAFNGKNSSLTPKQAFMVYFSTGQLLVSRHFLHE